MLFVSLEREVGYGSLEGVLWTAILYYADVGSDVEQAIDAALALSQEHEGGTEEWLDQFFPHDKQLRISVMVAASGCEAVLVFQNEYVPRNNVLGLLPRNGSAYL